MEPLFELKQIILELDFMALPIGMIIIVAMIVEHISLWNDQTQTLIVLE